MSKVVKKEWEREVAWQKGGAEAAEKVEDDYHVKKSKEKAESIINRMREKIENA